MELSHDVQMVADGRDGRLAFSFGHWREDKSLLLLVADRELEVEALEKAEALKVWASRQWGVEPHWLLLDRQGATVFEKEGLPTGEAVVEAIHDTGAKTAWEKREAFLRDNPDNGEALEERLVTSLALASARFNRLVECKQATSNQYFQSRFGKLLLEPPEADTVADEIFAETAETLERLLIMPDGWRLSPSNILRLSMWLNWYDAGASPRMRAVLHRFRDEALSEWAKSPVLESGFQGASGAVGDRAYGHA